MRLIDADKLTEGMEDWDEISVQWIRNQPTVEAIPIEWLERFERLMAENAYWGIKEAISQWNGDYEIIDEARQCIDSAFRKAMKDD